jgi:hypothetical protein
MRPEDFLSGKFKDLKFRISYPDELVTTQKEVDQFAIGFAEWAIDYSFNGMYSDDVKELLEIYKKEQEL